MSTPITYEPYGGLDFLFQRLNALAPGGAHNGVAPPDLATYPFIIYAATPGNDLMTVGAYRVWNDTLYIVKACGPATMADAIYTLAATIDTTLHRQAGVLVANGGVLMLSCTREGTIDLPEPPVNGVQRLNVGGIYRIYAQAQP